jgi:hypothetical protein
MEPSLIVPESNVEILDAPGAAPADIFHVFAAPHPFSIERVEMRLPEGGTIADIIAAAGIPRGCTARVTINGVPCAEEWWPRVKPRKDSVVAVRAVPMNSGGQGQDRNKTMRIVLQIVVLIVAAVASWYLGPIAGLLVSVGGSLAINALTPPPPPLGGAVVTH